MLLELETAAIPKVPPVYSTGTANIATGFPSLLSLRSTVAISKENVLVCPSRKPSNGHFVYLCHVCYLLGQWMADEHEHSEEGFSPQTQTMPLIVHLGK